MFCPLRTTVEPPFPSDHNVYDKGSSPSACVVPESTVHPLPLGRVNSLNRGPDDSPLRSQDPRGRLDDPRGQDVTWTVPGHLHPTTPRGRGGRGRPLCLPFSVTAMTPCPVLAPTGCILSTSLLQTVYLSTAHFRYVGRATCRFPDSTVPSTPVGCDTLPLTTDGRKARRCDGDTGAGTLGRGACGGRGGPLGSGPWDGVGVSVDDVVRVLSSHSLGPH